MTGRAQPTARTRVAIVTTTIHVPKLLTDYAANAHSHGHTDVEFIVIGDKKTPAGVTDFCRKVAHVSGYDVQYYDIAAQQPLLNTWPELAQHIPYNSVQRRNLGLLKAYQDGAEVIITIDDDNFVHPDYDYVGLHSRVGQVQTYTALHSSTGWYNVGELLTEKHGWPIFHRGFPLPERWVDATVSTTVARGKVVVNAGLWLGAPDIDAVTWLDLPIEATALRTTPPTEVGLAAGTWCPFNSQNTALAREVLPAYFLSPYVGRYDDVWASYLLKRIADHLGDVIHFGLPLVRQDRNPHNYFKDFDAERLGMEMTPAFVSWLKALPLSGRDYASCFAEIATAATEQGVLLFGAAGEKHAESLTRFIAGLGIWQRTLAGMSVPA